MKKFQRIRCGATSGLRYCLPLLFASLLACFLASSNVGCGSDSGLEAASQTISVDHEATDAPNGSDAPIIERRSRADSRASTSDTADSERPVVVFLGTSLTAGYGLREDQAFPALLQKEIEAAGLAHRVVNAGVSGDTSAGGLRRLDWLLRLPISVLVLELGANDMLRGLSVDQLVTNLQTILDQTREAHPEARLVIAGMRAAPNLGVDYREAFDAVYPELAERYEARFVPFLLEDVAAKRDLNQADGIHPTAEGHALIAKRIWSELQPTLSAD